MLKFDWSDRLGNNFSDFALEGADEAGHFVHFEQPEQANARMLGFLRRVLGA